MNVETRIPLLEEILDEYLPAMGKNYTGYKNHCYRMLHFCFYLRFSDAEGKAETETKAERTKHI
mgnify:CR=1 FL=1